MKKLLVIALFLARSAQAIEVDFEKDSSLPLVYLNIAIKAGAVTDPKGQAGLTNFMGEMLLRGTTSRTKEQIDLELDQMGASLMMETRAEALILRGAVLAAQLDPFLRLVSDILTHPSLPPVEIRKLKSEVISQILEELGNDSGLGSRKFTEFLFQDHPYGKPILGTTKQITALTLPQIRAHYEQLIRDPNLIVLGTGDANPDVIKKWADGLAKTRAGDASKYKVKKVDPPKLADKRQLLIVDKPERTQTQIHVGHLGVMLTDGDFFPLYVGNYIFGGGSFSSRLMQEVRVKRGWSYGAGSYYRHGLQPRSWQMHLFPASKDTPSALALVLQMANELKEKGVTPDEFNFAKESLVNSAGFMYNTPKKRVENRILEKTLDLPEGFMKAYGTKIAQVTPSQVNEAWKKYLQPERFRVTVVATAKDLKEPLAKTLGVPVDEVQVVPYTEE